jgi:predicted AlkP superfamily phosphohydrolase/phosphomutase
MTDFPVANLKWGEMLNLMIKGDGGDPDIKREDIWTVFYKRAREEKEWLEENAWNSNEKIIFAYKLQKRDWFLKNLIVFANHLTDDRNKLKLVTEECMQLINYIGNKIEKVEVIKYEERENEE